MLRPGVTDVKKKKNYNTLNIHPKEAYVSLNISTKRVYYSIFKAGFQTSKAAFRGICGGILSPRG